MFEKFNASPEKPKKSFSKGLALALAISVPTLSPSEGGAETLSDFAAGLHEHSAVEAGETGSLSELAADLEQTNKSLEFSRKLVERIHEKYPEVDFSTSENWVFPLAILDDYTDINNDGDFDDAKEKGFVIVSTGTPQEAIPYGVVGSVEIVPEKDYFKFQTEIAGDIVLSESEILNMDDMLDLTLQDRELRADERVVALSGGRSE